MSQLWVLYDPTKETQSEKLTTEEAQFAILKLKTKLINEYLIWREDWTKWKKLNLFLDSSESPFMNLVPITTEENTSRVTSLNESEVTKTATLKMSPADQDTISKVKSSFDFSQVKIKEVHISEVFGKTKQQFDGDQFSSDHNFDSIENRPTSVDFNFKSLNKVTAFSKRNLDESQKIELLLIHPKGHMFRSTAHEISLTGTFSEKIIPSEFHNSVFDVIIINNVIKDDYYKRLTLKGTVVVTDSRTYIQYVNPTDDQKNILRAGLDYYLRAIKKNNEKT